MINATSKNTGMATKKPASIMDHGAFFIPNFFNKKAAITCAPPECSKTAPKSEPRPTTVATKPKVPPMPSVMDLIMAVPSKPLNKPTTIAEINKAMNACSFNLKIKKRSSAIPERIASKRLISMYYLI